MANLVHSALADDGRVTVVINPTDGFRRVLMVTGLCHHFGLGDSAEAEASAATGA